MPSAVLTRRMSIGVVVVKVHACKKSCSSSPSLAEVSLSGTNSGISGLGASEAEITRAQVGLVGLVGSRAVSPVCGFEGGKLMMLMLPFTLVVAWGCG
jgi:hypothetical protein